MAARARAKAPARYEITGVYDDLSPFVALAVDREYAYSIGYTVEIRDGVKWATLEDTARIVADKHGINYGELESYLLSEIEAP
jgi:hypothetical protein